MNKLYFILLIFLASCSKDGISPKNKRNVCSTCVLTTTNNNTGEVTTLTKSQYDATSAASISDWCTYLSTIKTGTFTSGTTTTTVAFKCN